MSLQDWIEGWKLSEAKVDWFLGTFDTGYVVSAAVLHNRRLSVFITEVSLRLTSTLFLVRIYLANAETKRLSAYSSSYCDDSCA